MGRQLSKVAYVLALVVDGQAAVAATGADDDGGTVRLVSRRQIDRQVRLIGRLGSQGAGRLLRPEHLGFRRVGGGGSLCLLGHLIAGRGKAGCAKR